MKYNYEVLLQVSASDTVESQTQLIYDLAALNPETEGITNDLIEALKSGGLDRQCSPGRSDITRISKSPHYPYSHLITCKFSFSRW